MRVLVVILGLGWCAPLCAGGGTGNWSGDYAACAQHGELRKTGHLSLGVRLSVADPKLEAAVVRALDWWSGVLDMEWHKEEGSNCSIHVFIGRTDLFKPMEAARSQFPDARTFQGWIAFNQRVELSADEQFQVAVHELGHVFGLPHNPSARSLMYFIRLDGPPALDGEDLAKLGSRHRLRPGI